MNVIYKFFYCSIFTRDEIEELRRITLWDIIVNSTSVGPGDIQRDVFHWNSGDPCPQPYQLNATKLAPCKYLKGYDYFEVRFRRQKRLVLNNFRNLITN